MKNPYFLIIIIFSIMLFSWQTVFSQETEKQQEIQSMIDRGIEYERVNKLDRAIEIYCQILELDPDNILIKVRLAKIFSWQNKFDEALKLLDEVLKISPQHSEALFRKAQILSWQGHYKEAINFYELYLTKEKNDADALMGIARVCFWSGEYEKAIEYFNRAVSAGADEVEVGMELGKVYLAMDNKKKASEEFKLVLELDPDNKEAKRFLRGIELLKTVEIEPMGIVWELYPDGTEAVTMENKFTYNYKQLFSFILTYQDKALNSIHDQSFNFGGVFMGIKNFYLSASFGYIPEPDFSPKYQLETSFDYGLGAGFVPGIRISAEVYPTETLFTISPRITKYFTDYTYAVISYYQYIYSSGYRTLNISFNLSMEYLPKNPLYLGVSYGGDVETKDPERRHFDFNTGISFKITENLVGIFEYSWIETKYGRTNRIGYRHRVQW